MMGGKCPSGKKPVIAFTLIPIIVQSKYSEDRQKTQYTQDIYLRLEFSLWQELHMKAVEKEGTKPQKGPMRFPNIAGYPFFLGLMVIAPY